MKEIKLKKCPFCGGSARFETRAIFASKVITVKCKECEVECKPVELSLDYSAREMAAEK